MATIYSRGGEEAIFTCKYGLALTFFAAFFRLPQHDGEQEALQKGSCSGDDGRGRLEGGSQFSQYDGAGPKRSQDPCVPVEFLCSRRGVFSPSAFKAVTARDRYLQVSLRACASFHVYLNFLISLFSYILSQWCWRSGSLHFPAALLPAETSTLPPMAAKQNIHEVSNHWNAPSM